MKKTVFSFILSLAIIISVVFTVALPSSADDSDSALLGTSLNLAENITIIITAEPPVGAVTARVTYPSGELASYPATSGVTLDIPVEIAVKDFSKEVTLELLDEDGNLLTSDKTSAAAYCENYRSTLPEGEFIKLIGALEEYSAAADYYFDSEKTAPISGEVDLSAIPDLSIGGVTPVGLFHRGVSLILESETTVRHYFELDEDARITDYIFFVDKDNDRTRDVGEMLFPSEKLNKDGSTVYYVDISGITPNELDIAYTLCVTEDGGIDIYSCAYGALTYAKRTAASSTNSELVNLSYALYKYNKAASELVGRVTFDGVEGMTYEYGVTTPIVKPVKKDQSTFLGWYDQDGVPVTEIAPSDTGVIVLTSRWSDGASVHTNGFDSSSIIGWNYCTDHNDTNADGICDNCYYCADITACQTYSTKACSVCGKSRTNYGESGYFEHGSKSSAICALPVTVGDSKASLFLNSGSGTVYDAKSAKSLYDTLFDSDGNKRTNSIVLDLSLGMPSAEQIAAAKDAAVVFGAVPEKYLATGVQFGNGTAGARFNLFGITADGYISVLDSKAMKLSEGLNSFKIVIDTSEVSSDGVINDTIYVELYGSDGALVTRKAKALTYDISTYNRTKDVFRINFNDSGYLIIDEFKVSASPLVTNAVEYPEDAILPEGVATTFTPGVALPLADTATKSGYEFAGWYADETLTKPIDEIPASAAGAVKVYARWIKAMIDEDYQSSSISFVDHTTKLWGNLINGVQYYETDGKAVTYNIEEQNGDKYLFWQTADKNPSITRETDFIAKMSGNKVSYVFEIAKGGTDANMNVKVRVRNQPKLETNLFTISNGNVVFNGKTIATLREDEFISVKVVLDFDLCEIRLCTSESYEEHVLKVTLPERSTFTREVFSMWSASAGAVKISRISAYEGDVLARERDR